MSVHSGTLTERSVLSLFKKRSTRKQEHKLCQSTCLRRLCFLGFHCCWPVDTCQVQHSLILSFLLSFLHSASVLRHVACHNMILHKQAAGCGQILLQVYADVKFTGLRYCKAQCVAYRHSCPCSVTDLSDGTPEQIQHGIVRITAVL